MRGDTTVKQINLPAGMHGYKTDQIAFLNKDLAFIAGAALTGALRLPDGRVPEHGVVIAVDAGTHDQIAFATTDPDGRYTVRYAGPVRAAFAVIAAVAEGTGEGWHRGATDFTSARVVRLPAGGTPALDLRAPALAF